MKHILLMAILGLTLAQEPLLLGQTYEVYEWSTSDLRRSIYENSEIFPFSPGLSGLSSELVVGNILVGSRRNYYRAFYQWDIPDSVIPNNAIIDTVQLYYIIVDQVFVFYVKIFLSLYKVRFL